LVHGITGGRKYRNGKIEDFASNYSGKQILERGLEIKNKFEGKSVKI